MRKSNKLLKRKMAGMMAAVMLFSVIPAQIFGDGAKAAVYTEKTLGKERSSPSDAREKKASPSQSEHIASPAIAVLAVTGGTTYYVDAKEGNDSADGKSEETAWKSFDRVNSKTFLPGDKILLKADGIWNQPLSPKGSGQEGNPITIDMYGEGNRPVINGNGTSGPSITGAVTIYNEEYWELYNLEVTNLENTDQPGELMDGGTKERAGILIYSSNQEKIYKHIVVKNCYVHDVNSDLNGMKTSGGIIVIGHYLDKDGNRVTIDDNGKLTAKAMGRAAFSDVVIEGNYVKNVAIEGIRNKCNTDITGSGWGSNEFLKNFSDVTIRNNYLQDVTGDGIVLTETIGGLIEGNMVNSSCGMDRGARNFAQCWTMFADDIVIQYNEAYGNKFGYDDGEAYDSDMKNNNNIFQYNLSHDCGGGAMLFMASQRNTIFRYNLSINDGTGTYPNGSRLHQQVFHYDNTSSPGANVGKIYNNTIVLLGQGKRTALFGGSAKKNCVVDFKNNIVLAADGAQITFGVTEKAEHKSTILNNSAIENNCFWPASIVDTESGEGGEKGILNHESLKSKGNIFADPKLKNYKAGENYSDYIYPLEELEYLADSDFTRDRIRSLAEPYALTAGSPCIQAGQRIQDMPAEDMLGNTIAGRVDMGAMEYSVEDETADTVEEVKLVTTPGVLPALPKTLKVQLAGESYAYPVEWDELTRDDVLSAGVIELPGRLLGLSNEVKAMIVVADKPESFDQVEVSTFAGVYPKLPQKINALFTGGLSMELEVTWDKMELEQYSREGTFEINGTVPGLKEKCRAKITVLGNIGDGQTEKEVETTKDTYVQYDASPKNHGNEGVIKVKTTNDHPSPYTRRGLIEFDLTEQEMLLDGATNIFMKVQMTRPASESDYQKINKHFYLRVYEIPDTWGETEVTWNTQPSLSPDKLVVKDQKIVYTDIRDNHENIVEIDVTDWVKKAYAKNKQKKFSFLFVVEYYGEYDHGNNGGFDFASREAADKMPPTMVLNNIYEKKVEAASVTTPAGKAPTLPKTVTVEYSDGTKKTVNVEWNAINEENYQNEGSFVVYGLAEGVKLPVVCTVNVMEALHKVVAVKDMAQIIKLTGTPWDEVGLPQTVTVILDNGQEAEVGIQYWFPDNAYDGEKEFSYTCIGYLDLANHDSIENPDQKFASVTLNIIEPEDKNALLVLYTEAAEIINTGEADQMTDAAKAKFLKAFQKASAVLVDTKATELEVHTAYTNLMEAIWSLNEEENRRADVSALRDMILIAESKNKKDYTKESYDAMKEALGEAKRLVNNKNLTESYQYLVDDAYEALKEAVQNLELKGNSGANDSIVVGIEITKLPSRTEYKTGETFSSSGMVVSAVYSDGSKKAVRDYEVSNVNTSVAGVKDVVVTYRAAVNNSIRVFTNTFQISVGKAWGNNGSNGNGSGGGSDSGSAREIPKSNPTEAPDVKGTWESNGSSWKFQKQDGSYAVNEWAKVQGKWYHFNATGEMQTGWIADGATWYKLNSDGSMQTGWIQDEKDGHWYYASQSGAMQTGWQLIDGKWYYFNPVTQGNTGWKSGENGDWERGEAESGSLSMGCLYTNAMTPDGYLVDENGAWIQ